MVLAAGRIVTHCLVLGVRKKNIKKDETFQGGFNTKEMNFKTNKT